jgi:hypothetical protein
MTCSSDAVLMIESAFSDVPRPGIVTTATQESALDFEDAKFFTSDWEKESPARISHHGAFALGLFTEDSLHFFLPRILTASILDNNRSGVLLATLFSGLSGNSTWSKYLSGFTEDQICAVGKWVTTVDKGLVDSFRFDGFDPDAFLRQLMSQKR